MGYNKGEKLYKVYKENKTLINLQITKAQFCKNKLGYLI